MDAYEFEEVRKRFRETDEGRELLWAADGLTLFEIIRQIYGEQSRPETAAVVAGAKQRFVKQFPGFKFPWADKYVVDLWLAYAAERDDAERDGGPETRDTG
jgi:hypothetical protein